MNLLRDFPSKNEIMKGFLFQPCVLFQPWLMGVFFIYLKTVPMEHVVQILRLLLHVNQNIIFLVMELLDA